MDEDMRTLWCGNLSDKVSEEILYELFLQGGPVQRVSIPKDRDGRQRTYGFVTYKHIVSVSYALDLFDGTMLFNRPICMSTRNNMELQQKTNSQDQYLNNLNHLLQLGQQMLLENNSPHMKIDMYGGNMLPSSGPYSRKSEVHSYEDNRRSVRSHPYRREESKKNNRHKNHRSRTSHNSHRSNDYSRRDYKSNKHNYH
ncbi:uncharacterized protein LOC116433462 [Nomia melanderi]|uniref:uncharacterized protein LOC116433462 n=1 Tax=Nomia melanderi TaxID=2448451 RepID=UPI0013042939|nr:RNA-binding protein 7 [Nomia melanderi]XP_031847441.1 RNA-binding protein 7 [Nomia melanderi]